MLSDGLPFMFVCDAYRFFMIPTADLDVTLRAKYSELVIHLLSFVCSEGGQRLHATGP
jgi:hypothetical protein